MSGFTPDRAPNLDPRGLFGFIVLDQFDALNVREWAYLRADDGLLDDVPAYPAPAR